MRYHPVKHPSVCLAAEVVLLYFKHSGSIPRGMHVLPAKHSYAWLPRKCNYWTDTQTDRQTDGGQCDPYVPLCFAGDTKTIKLDKYFTIKLPQLTYGAAVVEGLSSWLAEQGVRGSIPGLATWISEIVYLLLPSRDIAEIPLKRRKSSIQPTTNQPQLTYV